MPKKNGFGLTELMPVMLGIVVMVILVIVVIVFGRGCSQWSARKLGGSITVDLPAGEKLLSISWKDDEHLWALHRPMRHGETPENYTYAEQSKYGLLQGRVLVNESPAEK